MNLEIVEIFKFHFINSLNAKVVIIQKPVCKSALCKSIDRFLYDGNFDV